MLPFLSITGILLSVILISFNMRKNPSTIYLGFFFLLISIYSFNQYVMMYSESTELIGIFFLNAGSVVYLTGPMLYWYTRSILTDDFRLKKNDIWHFLPMIVFLIATLSHLLSPWSHKIEIASKIIEDRNYVWIYNRTLFHELVPAFLIFMSRPALILGYTIWSIVLLVKYVKRKNESRILSQQSFMSKWFILLFFFLIILIVCQSIQIIEVNSIKNIVVFYTLTIFQYLSGIGLVGLLISPFFFPEILYGIPRLPGTLSNVQKPITPDDSSSKIHSAPRYEENYMLSIEQKAQQAMETYKPYVQPDFNLNQLSVLIKIPVHHLAYYFREYRKQSFQNYKNEWRIACAKRMIEEGKASEITLEAIGKLSGFSSRNTFLTTFKKMEGLSPGTFVAKMKP